MPAVGKPAAGISLDRILPYAMISPAVVVAVMIAVVPLIYEVWLSFQDWYMLKRQTPVFGGFINYIDSCRRRRPLGGGAGAPRSGPWAP